MSADSPEHIEGYVLATGSEGEDRLELVEEVHGPDTERLLQRAGIERGMNVADIGCGIGIIAGRIADMVGPSGECVGIDDSEAQIEVARRRAAESRSRPNLSFQVGSAYQTGLPDGALSAVYARFLLMHLARPTDAIAEMIRLLRPGGILIVEDGDFSAPYCVPVSPAYDRCFELYREAVKLTGADPLIGADLPRLVMDSGFRECNVAIVQPMLRDGEAKRLPEWTLGEAAPALIEAGIASGDEIAAITMQMRRLALDSTTKFAMAQMTQVWARKS